MDSNKIEIRNVGNCGKGVYAKEPIGKDETIAVFDGEIYDWEDERWTNELADHCIQFEKLKYRDSNGVARLINHSCEPNCGIKNLFEVVAMRDIDTGEEITWDYEMTEKNSKEWWSMECKCGSKNCRKIIGNFDNMPQEVRKKYKGYISEWLLN